MSDVLGNESFNNVSVLSENGIKEQMKQEHYTKEEVLAILKPMFEYLEKLSETYEITLSNGLNLGYRRPLYLRDK